MNATRLARARHTLDSSGLDALVVTHPPNIRYLTGLQASAGAALLMRHTCLLVVDFRYVTAARALAEQNPDLSVHQSAGPLEVAVADVLGATGAIRAGFEAEHLSVARFNRLQNRLRAGGGEGTASLELVPTDRAIERLRAVKDADEIATLREAARRLSAVARRAGEWVRPGRTEREVAALVEDAMRQAGFERPAFETIVASGPNSALPHARPGDRGLRPGDAVVLDFGGIYDGYCVDLTRTLQLGEGSPDARRLFEAVAEAHQAAIAAIRPGVLPSDIDAAARRVLERHGLGDAFGHGTGHGLGLEVHEEPRISKQAASSEPVTAGMVFTVEPGAYVPGLGGVRIEDDVLVVEGGCELLTQVPIDFGEV